MFGCYDLAGVALFDQVFCVLVDFGPPHVISEVKFGAYDTLMSLVRDVEDFFLKYVWYDDLVIFEEYTV